MAEPLPPLKPIAIKEHLSILFVEKGQRALTRGPALATLSPLK
ncbi:hypothetical protein [Acidithiobacillus sp.]